MSQLDQEVLPMGVSMNDCCNTVIFHGVTWGPSYKMAENKWVTGGDFTPLKWSNFTLLLMISGGTNLVWRLESSIRALEPAFFIDYCYCGEFKKTYVPEKMLLEML